MLPRNYTKLIKSCTSFCTRLISLVLDTPLRTELGQPNIYEAPSGSHLIVHLSVAEAEHLLDTKYNIFKHVDGSEHVGKLTSVRLGIFELSDFQQHATSIHYPTI